jgi:hypothetical protein
MTQGMSGSHPHIEKITASATRPDLLRDAIRPFDEDSSTRGEKE